MAAAAAGKTGLSPEDLGSHLPQINAACDRKVVRAVTGGNHVVSRQISADTRAHRLLAVGGMQFAGKWSAAESEDRLLSDPILFGQAIIECATANHDLVHVATDL